MTLTSRIATAALLVAAAFTAGERINAGVALAKVGSAAPEFTAADTRGAKHSLGDFAGKYVVLEWVNHGCPFVKKHYSGGNMQLLQKKYTEAGVVWLSVASSAEGKQGYMLSEEWNETIKETSTAATAVLLDVEGTIGKMYGARTTPQMVVIDPKGVVIYAGAIDDKPSADVEDIAGARNHVASALDEAMSGKPVSVSASQPYGCSVKYK